MLIFVSKKMEQSIFNANDRDEITARIRSLNAGQQALWGKMDVGQMLEHCIQPMEVGLGKLSIPRRFLGLLFGSRILRKTLGSATKQFKRNLPTDPLFIVSSHPEFEESRQKLLNTIEAFTKLESQELAGKIHPFFGKMDRSTWGRLQYVHLNHHLTQFGV